MELSRAEWGGGRPRCACLALCKGGNRTSCPARGRGASNGGRPAPNQACSAHRQRWASCPRSPRLGESALRRSPACECSTAPAENCGHSKEGGATPGLGLLAEPAKALRLPQGQAEASAETQGRVSFTKDLLRVPLPTLTFPPSVLISFSCLPSPSASLPGAGLCV